MSDGSGLLVVSAGDPGGIGGGILLPALEALGPGHRVLLALPRDLAHAWLRYHGVSPEDLPRVAPAGSPPGPGFWCLGDEPGWPEPRDAWPARPTAEGGHFAWRSLERAVDRVLANPAGSALVTVPIHKQAMNLAGFPWPGHTEYLEQRGGLGTGLMLMHGPRISVGLATNHLPIAEVAGALEDGVLEHKIRLCCSFMAARGLHEELVVLGLDPHCGDGGAIGDTDTRRITPLVERLAREGLAVCGPRPADSALARGEGRFLAMYHDQGLPVFKLVAGGEGVNLTLGLPFVRVSPDHGTAYDIVGTGRARPDSLLAAFRVAADLLAPGCDGGKGGAR